MRKSCIDCVEKHLGSAAVYIEETQMGYPDYRGFAIGELQHAASESLDANPGLAWAIREHRILWQRDTTHKIPFEAMFSYLGTWRMVDALGKDEKPPEVPEGVFEGIPEGPDGSPQMSMDTRP